MIMLHGIIMYTSPVVEEVVEADLGIESQGTGGLGGTASQML